MSKPAVPSIPPLSSISDPNVRAVLQALVDGQRIRNGDVGDGDEKFLTVGDLERGASISAVSGDTPVGTGSRVYQSVGNALRKISNQIVQSRAWKLLDQGITRLNSDVATVQQQLTTVSDQTGDAIAAVTTMQSQIGEIDAAAQEALTLSTSIDTTVKGAWSVKFDVNGYVAGVALGVEQKTGNPPKSSFVVRADTFAVGSPGVSDVVPFFVQNGVTYIQKAMIPKLTADMIDTRGLAVKDASGNIILGSGTALSASYAAAGTLNSAISIASNGALSGGGGGQVTYGGIGGKAMGLIDYIHSGNVSSYIATAAIGTAYIGDAAITAAKIADGNITNAKIGDAQITTAKIGAAQVDTLRIAGESVTVPRYAVNGSTSAMYLESGQNVVVIAYVTGYGAGGGSATIKEVNTGAGLFTLSVNVGESRTSPGLFTAPSAGWFAFGANATNVNYTIVALGAKR